MKAFSTYVTARPATSSSSLFSATARMVVAVAVFLIMACTLCPVQGYAATSDGATNQALTTSASSASTTSGTTVAEGTTITITTIMPLVQTGNYTVEDESKAVQKATSYTISTANQTAIKNKVRTAAANPTTTGTGIKVDLSDLAIPTAMANGTLDSKTTTSQVSPLVSSVINENPDFFYIANSLSIGYGYSNGKWTINSVTLSYSVSASSISTMRASYATAIANAIKWIPANGTDYQKAKAAHDWLVRNCAYNTIVYSRLNAGDSNPSVYYQNTYKNLNPWTAYGALVNKTGTGAPVCEGYSLAFIAMMNRAGIDADFIVSGDESHGWNRVKMANKWYHIDVTHDDPLDVNGKDQGFNATPSTSWFSKSDSYLERVGGVHRSWTPAKPACTDTSYNNKTNWETYKANASNPIGGDSGKNLALATITVGKQVYSGAAATPIPTVKIGTTTLVNNTHYTLSYKNNTTTGTATVTVTGKGNYWGSKSATFKIVTSSGVELTASNTTATFASTNSSNGTNTYKYTGQTQKPTLTLKYGNTVLTQGTDYTVTYPSDVVNPGTKTVTIKPIGKYLNGKTFTVSYSITASLSDTRVTITAPSAATYNGKVQKKAATVKFNGATLKAGTDYTITYPSDCTNVGTKTCTIKGKGALSGTRVYSYSIKQTSMASATVTVASSVNYTGSQVKPAVKATIGGTTLKSGTDYTVVYSNNIKPGKATAFVSGKGNMTGAVAKTFTINEATTAVYWIVSKKTGENLYTTSWNEVNTLCNKKKTWTNKGIMWHAPNSGSAVYRLVNKKTGDHHFTMSKTERDTLVKRGTWQSDFSGKAVFYSGGKKPIYRLWNKARWQANKAGTHRFATSNAKISGWTNEGIKLYAAKYK